MVKLNVCKLSKSTIVCTSFSENNIENENYTLRNEDITIPVHKYIAFVSFFNLHYSCRYVLARELKKENSCKPQSSK